MGIENKLIAFLLARKKVSAPLNMADVEISDQTDAVSSAEPLNSDYSTKLLITLMLVLMMSIRMENWH